MSRRPRSRWHRAVAFGSTLLLSIIPGSDVVFAANGSVIYSYDPLGRIVTAGYDTGVCVIYAYDAVGNRTKEAILVTTSNSTGYWGCFNWNGAYWGAS